MNKIFVLGMLSISLSSCTSIGSKEALFLEDSSHWKTVEAGRGDYHSYRCKSTSVVMDEIIIAKKTAAFGPIIPIFPGADHDFKKNQLIVDIELVGLIEADRKSMDHFPIVVTSNGRTLTFREQNLYVIGNPKPKGDGVIAGQYQLQYVLDEKLEYLGALKIEFNFALPDCILPDILLKRRNSSDSEFTVAPGA